MSSSFRFMNSFLLMGQNELLVKKKKGIIKKKTGQANGHELFNPFPFPFPVKLSWNGPWAGKVPYISIILERRQRILQPATSKMQLIGNNRFQCFIMSLLIRAATNIMKRIVISFTHHVSGSIQFTTPDASYVCMCYSRGPIAQKTTTNVSFCSLSIWVQKLQASFDWSFLGPELFWLIPPEVLRTLFMPQQAWRFGAGLVPVWWIDQSVLLENRMDGLCCLVISMRRIHLWTVRPCTAHLQRNRLCPRLWWNNTRKRHRKNNTARQGVQGQWWRIKRKSVWYPVQLASTFHFSR